MITYTRPTIDLSKADLSVIAEHMYALMMRNVASDGFVFNDPVDPRNWSLPGCVLAAPSFPKNTLGVDQDYVFNWSRDAAITAMEIAAANPPAPGDGGMQELINYVNFAKTCYANAVPTKSHACFTINGASRPWTEQNDGPALQSVAILNAFDQLDPATQTVAKDLIANNVNYLLGVYQDATTTGFEKSVRDLTWSYASFLSAVRAKTGLPVEG